MRGMGKIEMKKVANWMKRVSEIVKDFKYKEDKEERKLRL